MAAMAEQIGLAGSAMARVRPVDPLAVGAGHQEEPFTRRRVAEIGRIEDAPLDLEPGALQGGCPGAKIFAVPALDRFSGAQIKRAPIDEFRYVLDEQPPNSQFGAPMNDRPGVHAALIVDRFA